MVFLHKFIHHQVEGIQITQCQHGTGCLTWVMTMNKTTPASKTQHMLVTMILYCLPGETVVNAHLSSTICTLWGIHIGSSLEPCDMFFCNILIFVASDFLLAFPFLSLSFILPPSVLKTSAFRAPNSFCRPPPTRCSTVRPSFWVEALPSRPRPLWAAHAPLWAPLSPRCPPLSPASAVEESWWPYETLRSTVTITYTINISSVRRRRPPHRQLCPAPPIWVTMFTRHSSSTRSARTRFMKTQCGVW